MCLGGKSLKTLKLCNLYLEGKKSSDVEIKIEYETIKSLLREDPSYEVDGTNVMVMTDPLRRVGTITSLSNFEN